MVKKRALPLIILGFIFCLPLSVPPLYAGGRPDRDLSRADALIAEKNYDEAILILSDFSRKKPERFAEAQVRLQKIYLIRDEYNRVAAELLDEVNADSPNPEKMLALTGRLEELESANNPMVRTFINRVRDLAQFNQYRQRLNRILVQGRERLDRGDYEGALRTYYGGLELYRDEFFEAGYGEAIEERVNWGIGNINVVVEAFARTGAPLGQAALELARAVNQNAPPAQIDELYKPLADTMNGLISLQRLLYETAAYYDRQLLAFQQEDSTVGDQNFLSFASRLIQGRPGEAVQEGMIGALEGYWNSTAGRAAQALQNRTDTVYAAALASIHNRNFAAARQNFIGASEYCRFPLGLIDKNRELKDGRNAGLVSLFERNIPLEDLEEFLKYATMSDAIQYLIQGAVIGGSLETYTGIGKDTVSRWRAGTFTATEALRREHGFRVTLDTLVADIDPLLVQIDRRESGLRDFQAGLEQGISFNINILAYVQNARAVISNLRSSLMNELENSAVRYYTIANGELEKRLALRREQYAEGRLLIGGLDRTTDDGAAVTEYFPAEGLAVLSAMNQALTADIQEADAILSRHETEPEELASGRTIASLRNSARPMANELAALRTGGQNLAATARNQIAQAEAYRMDGVRYYREAQNALSRQNFVLARDRVTRAAEQFNSSLAIQESAALRNEWDTQLVFLGREINRIENELVIRDVRGLVTNARNAYFGGSFESAEEMLIRAQNRWLVTNSENDEEVDYWLNIVRGAVSLRSGRVIPSTAPLYPEMSQLLSEAHKDYEEGVRLLNTGRRSAGVDKFNEARQKTREVKLMFPVNQEAGMLDLMMDRVLDPRAFETDFERRIRVAIAGTERRSIEAFADLQNLAEINSRYPGMAGILNRAEIAMGIRPPPPDPGTVARSDELTVSALRILDGNNTTMFEVALAQINEAISLNPNNTRATAVKDRLLNRIARPNSVVMNSQDEAAYNQALMEYQQGNYIMSLAILQRLLQNPQYRNIAKILELERRVRSLLL